MIRIAAVDDELHALERFERMALEFKELELCGLFESGEELLAYLEDHPLDAVFLDIEMPETSGLQLSEEILDVNENIDIIFVTAFNQYAVEAFELQAMDYILKPLTEERLNKTVKRLLKNNSTVPRTSKPTIECFGGFEVFINEEAMTFKNSKAKEILAFLVHKAGVPVSWEKVADAIWPNYDAEKAQANFHANTYLLRKRLTEAGISQILENSRGNYRIITEEVNCDFYNLNELLKKKQIIRKEDYTLIENLEKRGYMEESGYAWAYPKAGELNKLCNEAMDNFSKKF